MDAPDGERLQSARGGEMMPERDFKGIWIPKAVWLDERLTALEKVILMEIDSLDTTERGCFASNKHIADFCQCSETKVSKAIAKLVDLGYVKVKTFDGRLRELQSSLVKSARQPCKKDEAASQKVQDSNTDRKTVRKTDSYSVFKPPTVDEVRAYCLERKNDVDPQRFVDYYQARGWMIGKSRMKDWKAAVRTWEKPKPHHEPDILDGIF